MRLFKVMTESKGTLGSEKFETWVSENSIDEACLKARKAHLKKAKGALVRLAIIHVKTIHTIASDESFDEYLPEYIHA